MPSLTTSFQTYSDPEAVKKFLYLEATKPNQIKAPLINTKALWYGRVCLVHLFALISATRPLVCILLSLYTIKALGLILRECIHRELKEYPRIINAVAYVHLREFQNTYMLWGPFLIHIFQKGWLTRSLNLHHPNTQDLYTQSVPAKPFYKMNPELRFFYKRKLDFYYPLGVCQGESTLFAAQYENTQDKKLQESSDYIKSLAGSFQNGASYAATLIQSIWTLSCPNRLYSHLNLTMTKAAHIERPVNHDYSNLKILSEGTYLLIAYNPFKSGVHAVTYIKTKAGKGFYFDPNFGLKELPPKMHLELMIRFLELFGGFTHFNFQKVKKYHWTDRFIFFYSRNVQSIPKS